MSASSAACFAAPATASFWAAVLGAAAFFFPFPLLPQHMQHGNTPTWILGAKKREEERNEGFRKQKRSKTENENCVKWTGRRMTVVYGQ